MLVVKLEFRISEFLQCSLQLEKMIGKVKTGKYGSKILEEIANYCDSKKLDPEITGEKDNKVSKRAKTCMTPVLIDNSDEDEP